MVSVIDQATLPCPKPTKMTICYTLKSMKLDMNGPPMAPHGLVFSEHGATPSNMLSIWLPTLYEAAYFIR